MDILKIYDEQSSKWQELPALKGSNGLYVGNVEPTDPDIHVWIDTTDNGIRLVDYIYPVGSIYISVNNTSPSTLFGGTWEQIKDTFLLAAGNTYTAGETGGEAEHTHEYGLQYGNYYYRTVMEGDTYAGVLNYDAEGNITMGPKTAVGSLTSTYPNANTTASGSFSHERTTGNTSYASNMPPYLTVYVWKRVS